MSVKTGSAAGAVSQTGTRIATRARTSSSPGTRGSPLVAGRWDS